MTVVLREGKDLETGQITHFITQISAVQECSGSRCQWFFYKFAEKKDRIPCGC